MMNTTSVISSTFNYERIIAIYSQQLLLNPQARLYQYRGQAHLEQGNQQAAIADFQTAVRLYNHRGQTEAAARLQSRIHRLQTNSSHDFPQEVLSQRSLTDQRQVKMWDRMSS